MLLAFDRPVSNGDAMLIQKASARLALNLPHTSSSHLDALTCTLHNAWAGWIYITPCIAHSHTPPHAWQCRNTPVCTMTQAHMHKTAMHTYTLVPIIHSSPQLNTKQPEDTDSMVRIWYHTHRKERNTEQKLPILSDKKERKAKLCCNVEELLGNLYCSNSSLLTLQNFGNKKNITLICTKHVGATSSEN